MRERERESERGRERGVEREIEIKVDKEKETETENTCKSTVKHLYHLAFAADHDTLFPLYHHNPLDTSTIAFHEGHHVSVVL